MLLAIDVGNTNVVVGIFDGHHLVRHWRLETRERRTADEYGVLLRQLFAAEGIDVMDVDGAALACVVPPLTETMIEMCQRVFHTAPLVVGPGVRTGMPIRYDNPREVGADRIVNAVAAWERYEQATIVVDFGTAITFDAISAQGEYLGGCIVPGIGIALEALFHRASKLPRIEVVVPKRAIGRTTVESMQAGAFYGYVALVDGVVERIRGELGGHARVIATGGHATLLEPASQTIEEVAPLLTLEGLHILHERNRT